MAREKNNKRGKGFESMDKTRQRELSRRGGLASAQSDTANRGFASMDKSKQKEISRQGGKASQNKITEKPSRQSTQPKNEEDYHRYHFNDDPERDLNSLDEEDEMLNSSIAQASYSETDEDEDEGLGDGNLGRSARSLGSDEEG